MPSVWNQAHLYLTAAALLAALPTSAAPYISEVYLDSPDGPSIEISDLDTSVGVTLVIADATRYTASGFGKVLDAYYLPPSLNPGPVEMISEGDWPVPINDRAAATLSHLSPVAGLHLGTAAFDRLLLLYEGTSPLVLSDNPTTDPNANARHAAAPLADYLLLASGDLVSAYTPAVISNANTQLGTDLLARSANRSAGTLIARTNLPDQAVDLDQAYIGTPGEDGTFAVSAEYLYYATPGSDNLELLTVTPEPGGLAIFGLAAAVLAGRHRRQ